MGLYLVLLVLAKSLVGKIMFEMTYNVSSGMLNPTIPYCTHKRDLWLSCNDMHVHSFDVKPTTITLHQIINHYKPSQCWCYCSLERRARYLVYCMFVCSSTISRQPAGRFTPKFACRRTLGPDVSSPLLGVGGPRRAEKGANEIFVTMGVNGQFLHFGGF